MKSSRSTIINIGYNLDIVEENEGENFGKMEILLGQCKNKKEQFQMLSELSSWILMKTNTCLNNLNEFDNNKEIDINGDLKRTMYQVNLVNQWMQNCFSARNPKLDELAIFDKIELKNKLQNIIDSL